MYPGKLIVIEGADGAGKATQTKLLVERLRAEGGVVETLDFPQYQTNFFGAHLREWLDGRHGDFVAVPPTLASLLYAADRFESKGQLEAWLAAGATVVLDRYMSANMLHQGGKIIDEQERAEFLAWLDQMEFGVFKIPRPDLVLYLDVPHTTRQTLLTHATNRHAIDVVEQHDDYQRAADACALHLITSYGWHRIDCVADGAIRPVESIHTEIYDVVHPFVTK